MWNRNHAGRKRGCVRFAAVLMSVMLLAPAAAMAEIYAAEPPADFEAKLEWTVFDVNEGDAMLLTCGGENMMVDGGPAPFREALRDALVARGLEHMKYYLSTHYHDDHIDGLYYLFRYGFTAEEYLHAYSDAAIASSKLGKRTVAAAEANGVTVRRVADGDTLALGDAVIEIHQYTEIHNTNARSLMLRVTLGESRLLLCADIIGKTQHYFADHLPAEELRADLIKMPHHALTAAVPDFLDAVDAGAAVVTNRQANVPSGSQQQLIARGMTAFYSGEGTVYAVTDGKDWYIYQTPGEF